LPELSLFSGLEEPKPFLLELQQPANRLRIRWKTTFSSLFKSNATHTVICLTCSGDPNSLISCLLVGIIVTLTFSSGSITSLNTLSWPSITTSCPLPVTKEKQGANLNFHFSLLLINDLIIYLVPADITNFDFSPCNFLFLHFTPAVSATIILGVSF